MAWKEQKLQIKARTRMPSQHIIPVQSQAESQQPEGIVMPLDLPDLKIVKQEVQADGSIAVHVRALTDREACPRCRTICVKVHDTRMRVKRDIDLRNYQIRLVLYKRRFRCFACQRTFTEPDSSRAQGLRDLMNQFAHVADNYEVPGICNESARIPVLNQEGS
jgi:transposase-like protein